MSIESPQTFVVRQECQKAASQNGFRRILREEAGWGAFGSTTAKGIIYLAATGPSGPWFLAIDHRGVIDELGLAAADVAGPGRARFGFDTLGALYNVLRRVYELEVSLPDAPLREFEAEIANLPRTTEAERLIVERIGQNIYRDRLMHYWQGRCPLTGIADPALLRASHIIPWAECESDQMRLDVHNGLLLSTLWDAAFDAGLVSFGADGAPITSPRLSQAAATALGLHLDRKLLGLTDAHRANFAWHRWRYGFIWPP